MSKPLAVVISDIHFNLNTLELASQALSAAIDSSNKLAIPLIIAGDLNDSKAIIRGEVANRLISLLEQAERRVFILVGNHDLLNEKGDAHGLNYLRPYATIVDNYSPLLDFALVPYCHDAGKLTELLASKRLPPLLIMHQGFLGAQMGDYIQDKTSISPDLVKDYTVISGHYHRHQTIGTVTYIGSPFTMSFGEANDGPKGFLILNEDGSYTREILNLRRHVILETHIDELNSFYPSTNPGDIVWLKIKGPLSELQKLKKKELGQQLFGHSNFKLDLIATESTPTEAPTAPQTDPEALDSLIDELNESDAYKASLKGLWREVTGV